MVRQMLITDDGEQYHLSGKILSKTGENEQPTIIQLSDQNLLS